MKNKIAVIATSKAYRYFCADAHIPERNELFHHVAEERHCEGRRFSGYIMVGDIYLYKRSDQLEDFVKARVDKTAD